MQISKEILTFNLKTFEESETFWHTGAKKEKKSKVKVILLTEVQQIVLHFSFETL